jgi:predicted RNA-binding protein with PIN domain
MKKINLIFLGSLVLFMSCSKEAKKPQITVGNYVIQARTAKGVVEKIINEPDYKKMHEIALAVESSRAVSCITISNECNLLAQILNKIVNITHTGMPKDAERIEILKMINELDKELVIGQEIVAKEWSEYIKIHPPETK